MSTSPTHDLFDLSSAISSVTSVAAKHAVDVDAKGRFPVETLAALREHKLLGLLSSVTVGGLGLGLKQAAEVVQHTAHECGSSAMILCMHYCGVAVLEKHASEQIRREVASGAHLSTLAFSEAGSRSHFWAPLGTASASGSAFSLSAHKSWITSAAHATAYVWSSKPASAAGASSIWLVSRESAGLKVAAPFDGLGLRGNDSSAVIAENVTVDSASRLGPDGGGFDVMMGIVLPFFSVLSAACSVGLMNGALDRAIAHVKASRHQHLDSSVADLPTVRAYLSRAKLQTDAASTLLQDTVAAIESGRADAQLRVLEVKALCGESALEVTDAAMRVCGGAAFRKEAGVERAFRDSRAASVMAPTSDVLFDFLGKALVGLPLF
jgi:alkylation response protein AidB-like acyl-CoA dehydrogenase